MLILHIFIAISSIALSTLAIMSPSARKLSASKLLIAGTLGSGVLLAVTNRQQLLHVCMSGFVYTVAVTILTYAASRRLEAGSNS